MFVATINVPGYLPMDDDPPTFDTAQEAWAYLAEERERDEDQFPDDEPIGEYTETLGYLRYAAGPEVTYGSPSEDYPLGVDGTGTIYGSTPGYSGRNDLGLAYCVTSAQARCDAVAAKGTGTGLCDRPLDDHGQCDRASSHIV